VSKVPAAKSSLRSSLQSLLLSSLQSSLQSSLKCVATLGHTYDNLAGPALSSLSTSFSLVMATGTSIKSETLNWIGRAGLHQDVEAVSPVFSFTRGWGRRDKVCALALRCSGWLG
jgi:hypothetical protein